VVVCGILVLAPTSFPPSVALGGIKVAESDDITLELGLRLQPRIEYERVAALGGGSQGQRDFLVRRSRLKANGRVHTATYNFEWKIDGTDQIGASPSASVENAYIQYPLGHGVEVRAGLYDQPFSRDRLTSDSKQLAVDRGEVSNVPDALGLADNAVGFHFLGKLNGGRGEYALGLFDNRRIGGRYQVMPMIVGRLDLNLGSTKDVLRDAHFGKDSWYSVGLNGSYQKIQRAAGTDSSSNAAVGIDGMIDVPTAAGRLFVRSEVNAIRVDQQGVGGETDTKVWMVGVGLLVLNQRLQPFVRFDEVRLDAPAGGTLRDITYVGANLYQKGHNLKLQGDVRLQANTQDSVDGARLQAQMDF